MGEFVLVTFYHTFGYKKNQLKTKNNNNSFGWTTKKATTTSTKRLSFFFFWVGNNPPWFEMNVKYNEDQCFCVWVRSLFIHIVCSNPHIHFVFGNPFGYESVSIQNENKKNYFWWMFTYLYIQKLFSKWVSIHFQLLNWLKIIFIFDKRNPTTYSKWFFRKEKKNKIVK